MKIVVLDGYTLNPGDLDWAPLKSQGDLHVFDRTAPNEIVDRAMGAKIIFTNKTPIAGTTIKQLPKLEYIGVLATGYDVVDIQAAKSLNITVTNVPAYGADSVAQMCFSHILNITNRLADHCADVNKGGWSAQPDYCYWLSPQMELAGKTMGIIGFGQIGRATARLALAFGMNVIINTRTTPADLPDGIQCTDLNTLLAKSDFISLHCPLTESTKHIINKDSLQCIKPGGVLINASRGPLIEEKALANALNNGDLAAAGLDVLSSEPPDKNNPLLLAKNCFITPHIAWATREARKRLLEIAANNLRAFIGGTAQNIIS